MKSKTSVSAYCAKKKNAEVSGIARRYGYDTVQQFYTALRTAQEAMYKYQADLPYGKKLMEKKPLQKRLLMKD